MDADKIFVGRKAEIEQFKEVLEDPKGQAVVVVGQTGMGKTWLVNKMAEIAESHPKLKCGWVRYEVTPTDSVGSTMALMIDNAFEAAQIKEGSFSGTTRRLEQWKSLMNVINIGDLVISLKRDPAKNTREQFLGSLRQISKKMPDNGRAIFVIDPEKYMQKDCDQSWAIVVKQLPEKIKFVFAQRSEDILVESETFGALNNVSRIPDVRLDILDEESVDELLNKRITEVKYSVTEVRKVLGQYKGHPYALQGSLDLLKVGTKLEELPADPTGIAIVQWKKLSKRGKEAIRLFKAYAILEVGVPNEVVGAVSELDVDTLHSLMADNFLGGLLREEGEGRRIYHAILMDHIVEHLGEAERKEYHGRAVDFYSGKLAVTKKEKTKPDVLAAMRLAEHVLAAEGKEAFVKTCAYKIYASLEMLGLLDTALGFSKRALCMVKKDSEEEAAIRSIMGLAYRIKGDLDKAEKMHFKALKIEKMNNWEQGMAREYGNLGLIYERQGELDKAEEMHQKALGINKKFGLVEGQAIQFGNLGNIYYMKGELDMAEEMHLKSLEIDEKLGRPGGMAIQYSNLGLIYMDKGELDKAEELYRKALEIDEEIDHLRVAMYYGNLGIIYGMRGELDKAEEMQKKALEINERIGRLEGIASQYCNLGNVYRLQSDLDKAEEMLRKSLSFAEKVGFKDVIANAYSDLGLIYEQRGDIKKAKEYWGKALGLYKQIGMQHKVEEVEGWIEGLGSDY